MIRIRTTKWMSIAGLSWVVSATMATAQNNPTGNAARGDQFFQTSCALCHSATLGSGNTVVIKQGPTLVGVMGRKAGTSPHFGFTQALKDSGLVWNAATLDQYLTNPTTAVPGTSMPGTVPDASDRADAIAYLATLIVPTGVDLEKLPTVTGPDPDDWQRASPGDQHYITVADLAAPYATLHDQQWFSSFPFAVSWRCVCGIAWIMEPRDPHRIQSCPNPFE
jgi:cytochrome c2